MVPIFCLWERVSLVTSMVNSRQNLGRIFPALWVMKHYLLYIFNDRTDEYQKSPSRWQTTVVLVRQWYIHTDTWMQSHSLVYQKTCHGSSSTNPTRTKLVSSHFEDWGIPQILRSCSGLLVQLPSSSNHLLILQILAEVTAPGSLPCTIWLEVPLVTKQCIVLCSVIFNTYHNLYVCSFMVNCNYLFHFFFLPLFTVSSRKAEAKSNPLPNVSSMPGYLLREWTPKK